LSDIQRGSQWDSQTAEAKADLMVERMELKWVAWWVLRRVALRVEWRAGWWDASMAARKVAE
jgi:hypothetical protein